MHLPTSTRPFPKPHAARSGVITSTLPAARLPSKRQVWLPRVLLLGCVSLLGACSSMPFHIPFVSRAPDLTPARSSAENIIRVDAQMRSGCEVVDNIERPPSAQSARDPSTQRWVARTCNGDIAYDVITVPGGKGKTPTVKVVPAGDGLTRTANPNTRPALPD